MTQRKMKAQPPLSDAYLHGMPAKRRKVIGSTASCHRPVSLPVAGPSLAVCRLSDGPERREPAVPLGRSQSGGPDGRSQAHHVSGAAAGRPGEPGAEGSLLRAGDCVSSRGSNCDRVSGV